MSLTLHCIDTEWKLVSKCLQMCFLTEDHTAAFLADALQWALQEWGLEEGKVSCLMALVEQLWGQPAPGCVQHCQQGHALTVYFSIIGMFSHSWRRRGELGLPEHLLVTVSLLLGIAVAF